MSERFFKNVFLIGALWNLVGGIFILLLTTRIFAWAGLTPPDPPAYYRAWIALFMTFGIGYYMVYKDLYATRRIVELGIIGKLAFAAIFIQAMLSHPGQIPLFFVVPIAGDLVFVALFWMFLRYAKDTGH